MVNSERRQEMELEMKTVILYPINVLRSLEYIV